MSTQTNPKRPRHDGGRMLATGDQARNRYEQVRDKHAQVAGMAGTLWLLNWQHRPSGTDSLTTDIYIYTGADDEEQLCVGR